MDSTQWTMVAIFVATIAGLIKYQKAPQRVFIAASLLCIGLSFVSVQELLQNATNQGLVTLVLLVICSFALERTSFLRRIAYQLILSLIHI